MRHLIWLFIFCFSAFAEDKIEEHFFDKDGKPCSTAKWMAELKTGTLYKSEKASFGGIEYVIETHYSGIDTRDPVLNKEGKLVLIDSKTKEETPFTPLIFETVVIGPTKATTYDGFIARFEYQIDAKAKVDDVKAKIIAGAVVDDLAKDGGP